MAKGQNFSHEQLDSLYSEDGTLSCLTILCIHNFPLDRVLKWLRSFAFDFHCLKKYIFREIRFMMLISVFIMLNSMIYASQLNLYDSYYAEEFTSNGVYGSLSSQVVKTQDRLHNSNFTIFIISQCARDPNYYTKI